MLIGRFYHSLQAKGRLAVPARFRSYLGEQPILARGIEPCLQLLPFNIWSNLTQQLGNNPLAGTHFRQLRRLIAHNAAPAEFDAQGRIVIPKDLCDTAGLKHKVVVAGSIDWVEIWDMDAYHHHLSQLEEAGPLLLDNLLQK